MRIARPTTLNGSDSVHIRWFLFPSVSIVEQVNVKISTRVDRKGRISPTNYRNRQGITGPGREVEPRSVGLGLGLCSVLKWLKSWRGWWAPIDVRIAGRFDIPPGFLPRMVLLRLGIEPNGGPNGECGRHRRPNAQKKLHFDESCVLGSVRFVERYHQTYLQTDNRGE